MSNNNLQTKIGKNIKKLNQKKDVNQNYIFKLADLSLNTFVTLQSDAALGN